MKKIFVLIIGIYTFHCIYGQSKMSMDHSIYENWNIIESINISKDGRFISYETKPAVGDKQLSIFDTKNNYSYSIPRAYNCKFTEDANYITGLIKPPFLINRQAKLDKKKPDEMPNDSLFIYNTSTGNLEKFANIKSYKIATKGKNWIVFHHAFEKKESKKTKKQDSLNIKFSKIAFENKLADLSIYNPESGRSYSFENVSDYNISKNGNLIIFRQMARDSVCRSAIYAFSTKEENHMIIYEGEGLIKYLTTDEAGKQAAFLHIPDTTKVEGVKLLFWTQAINKTSALSMQSVSGLKEGWGISKYGKLYFSENGERLFFGTEKIIPPAAKDSLLKSEKSSLDVWAWHDEYLQPMQLKNLRKEKKRSFLSYYSIQDKKFVQLADPLIKEVKSPNKGDGDIMYGFSEEHYGKLLSWEGLRYRDIYIFNLKSGEKKLVSRKNSSRIYSSPTGKYLVYYDKNDSSWYSLNTHMYSLNSISKNAEVNFYDEMDDLPQLPKSYGIAGFSSDEKYLLVYDRYDIWKLDLEAQESPVCLSSGFGRKNKTRLFYAKKDAEEKSINLKKDIFFTTRNEDNMEGGIALLSSKANSKLKMLVQSRHSYTGIRKARDADVYFYRKGDFKNYNNIYFFKENVEDSKMISNANPQTDNYLWGDARLVDWDSFNGEKLKGILYTPENMDTALNYPMLVYFYENSSYKIYQHKIPSPSRSIINIPWCTSNGYIVFVPDITYSVGYPGESAYNAIVSGTITMTDKYPFINKQKIALQGQSWGGYQVAYLITRTNIYAAAMAGAPVSNMTSAYGGIRWGTGMSRMFQYEKTQSRIGGTLWEKPLQYIENSPVFYAPKVETPLLIMHNDNDGSVPWYQGIEYFVALRRLGKPVWLLNYNNEEHNLTKWPNRIDLSIRMMQFFDYYLKDEKEPSWMKNGVPAIEKNNINGYKLLN